MTSREIQKKYQDRRGAVSQMWAAYRKAQIERRGTSAGLCGVTGKECDEEQWCMYGESSKSGELKGEGRRRGSRSRKAIEACVLAIQGGYSSCSCCPEAERCFEAWRCFRKAPETRKLFESAFGRQRRMERGAAARSAGRLVDP